MFKRILTGLYGISIIIFILLFENAVLFPFLLAGVSIVALDEFFFAFRVTLTPHLKVLSSLGVFLCFFGITDRTKILINSAKKFLIYKVRPLLFFPFAKILFFILMMILITILALSIIENRKNSKKFFKNMATLIFGEIYIPFSIHFLILTRKIPIYGVYWVWLSINASFSTDIFAYFGGIKFGRHRLCPKISPNKTIEGAISGITGALITSLIYGFLVSKFGKININLSRLFMMSICASIASEIGDLFGSIIKRKCKIKDFGESLPGHGGFLDRLDSLVFAAPFVHFFLTQIGILKS